MKFAAALGLLAGFWVCFAIPSLARAEQAGKDTGKVTVKSASQAGKKGKDATSGKAEKASKEAAGGNGADEEEAGPADDSFTVVQIGPEDVRVIKSSQLTPLRNKLNEEYKTELKDYNDEKLAKAKAKKKFDGKKPVKKDFKVLATALKSEENAKAIKDKTLQAIEKKKKARQKK